MCPTVAHGFKSRSPLTSRRMLDKGRFKSLLGATTFYSYQLVTYCSYQLATYCSYQLLLQVLLLLFFAISRFATDIASVTIAIIIASIDNDIASVVIAINIVAMFIVSVDIAIASLDIATAIVDIVIASVDIAIAIVAISCGAIPSDTYCSYQLATYYSSISWPSATAISSVN